MNTLSRLFRRLMRQERAVAAVEFAFIFPLMVLVYLGAVEGGTLIITDRKVQTTAASIGDLVARSDGFITSSDLLDYVRAAENIMAPNDLTEFSQVIVALDVDSSGNATVRWSRKFSNNNNDTSTPYAAGSSYTLPSSVRDTFSGFSVIAAEASFEAYTPLLGAVFKTPIDLRRTSYFLPRYGGRIMLN